MNYVTIPPKKPAVTSRFARHALIARPKLEDSVASTILSRLWHKSDPEQTCIHMRGSIRFYIATTSEGHPIFRIETGEESRAFLHVFEDFSALLFENVEDGYARFMPHPLKLNRTFRKSDESEAKVQISTQKSMGSTALICRSFNDASESAYLDPHYPRSSGFIQDAAREIHDQIIDDAKWWLINAPVATQEMPPVGIAFDKAGPNQVVLLREVVHAGFCAAFSQKDISGLTASDIGRFKITSPYRDPKSNTLFGFKVRAEGTMSSFPRQAEYQIAAFISRAIKAHPDIHCVDYLGQAIVSGAINGQQLISLEPTQTPTSHEALQSYQDLLQWEADAGITQETKDD
jgi:hypothetical protein